MPGQLLKYEPHHIHGRRTVEECNRPPARSGRGVWRELPCPRLKRRPARNLDAKIPAGSHPTYVVIVYNVRRYRTDGAASSGRELGGVENKCVETVAEPT